MPNLYFMPDALGSNSRQVNMLANSGYLQTSAPHNDNDANPSCIPVRVG